MIDFFEGAKVSRNDGRGKGGELVDWLILLNKKNRSALVAERFLLFRY